MIPDHHTFSPLLKGLTGMLASFGGALVTFMSHLELILRVAGVGIGVACGVASLVSIIRNMPPRKKGRLP
jgi:hypothetical protein